MLRKILCVWLAVALANITSAGPGLADSKADKQAKTAERIRDDVAKFGLGDKAWVSVKLRDKSSLQGYISQKGEDSFSITDSESGQTSTVAYRDVTEVKGKGLSKGAKIAIWIGVAWGASILVGLVLYALGAGCGPGVDC